MNRIFDIFIGWRGYRYWLRYLRRHSTYDLNKMVPWSQARHTSCCGLCELYQLGGGPLEALAALALWQRTDGNYKPLVVFTDRIARGNGSALAQYIVNHNLGRVIRTDAHYNPNSGNHVVGYLWEINKRKWKKWVKRHVIFRE